MTQLTLNARIDSLKTNLSAVQPEKLINALVERSTYDLSLLKYLEALSLVEQPGAHQIAALESAKQLIAASFGAEFEMFALGSEESDINGAHTIVEKFLADCRYEEVIELFAWARQFEDNVALVQEPDNFLETAYMPLAILCLKSHLRLGKTPAEVAHIFRGWGKENEYGLFFRLGMLWPGDVEELSAVKAALGEKD